MMSIATAGAVAALAVVAPVVGPSSVPAATAASPAPGHTLAWALVGVWAVLGLVAAWGLGALRRHGIVGPERLAADESAWPLVGGLGAAFAALIGSAFVANGALGTLSRLGYLHLSPDLFQLLVAAAGDAGAAVVVVGVMWLRREDGSGLRLAGLDVRWVPPALAGGTAALFILLPLVVLASAGVEAVYQLLHLHKAPQHPLLQMLGPGQSRGLFAVAVLTAVVVAPAAEELWFRGLMQTALGRLFAWTGTMLLAPVPATVAAGPIPLAYAPAAPPRWAHTPPAARWAAVAVTSAVFAAVHYASEPAAVAPIFVLSVGLGFVYERSGNLYMTVATHALFNAAEIVLYLAVGGG